MHEVVAMRWVPSQEVLESHEDLYIVVRSQFYYVFPACLMSCRRSPVSREDPECHQVNVDGVAPVAVVLQYPDLGRLLLRGRADFVHVKELLVDGPPSVIVAKYPSSCFDHFTQVDGRKCPQTGGNSTWVRGYSAIHVKPQDRCARVQQSSRRACSILLRHAIHKEDLVFDIVVGEVDDHICALGYT